LKEVRDIKKSGGSDVSGPMKNLEKVVKDALTHRGFSEGEAGSFIQQIRKGEAETPESVIETIQKTIKETQRIITTEEPVESTIWRPSQFAPKGRTIEYFEDGKRKYMEVSPNLYKAMTGLNEEGANWIFKMLSKPAHWLRIGATSTPEFMLRNPIRDQYTAMMQTNFGFVPFIDTMGAMADVLGKTDAYYDWLRSGGAYSGFVELNRPALKKAAQELTASRSRKLLGKLNIVGDAQDLSQVMEQATRMAVYKKAVKAGVTPVEAGYQSREATIDFARRGGKMANWNRATAFFNAGLQGVDKTVRNAAAHPFLTAIKGAMGITLPSVLLYYANRDKEGFDEIPRWQKDLFWVHKVGDTWVRIPKPFLYGQVFGSLPERFLEYLDKRDPEAFEEFGTTMIENVVPVSGDPEGTVLPTALKPIMENWGNRNFFLERPIVSESTKGLTPPYQHGRYTSETAKVLGQKLDYSPSKIENLITGYFGGSGRYALEGSDFLINAIRAARGEPTPPKRPKELSDVPLVKGFVVRDPEGPSARSIQKFYENSDKAIKAFDTYNRTFGEVIARKQKQDQIAAWRKQRPLSTAEMMAQKPLTLEEHRQLGMADRFKKKHPELIWGPDMRKKRKAMATLNKQAEAIVKMDIPEKDKRRMLKNIDDARLKLAQETNKKLK
jgi:hypothetical protein